MEKVAEKMDDIDRICTKNQTETLTAHKLSAAASPVRERKGPRTSHGAKHRIMTGNLGKTEQGV